MRAILLPIKLSHVKRIFDGTKKYEYRRRIPKEPISKIYIYCTAPIKKVVGYATVLTVTSGSPSDLWVRTKIYSGITEKKYKKYFEGCEKAYAYRLEDIERYDTPKDLSEFGLSTPPQSFIYIDE